jgi:serine/threonine protein kinase
MAPEVTNKKEYKGSAADIWTIGVVFYILLTG